MKKHFAYYIFNINNHYTLFLVGSFVLFTPLWVWFMFENGFNWYIAMWLFLSWYTVIREYIKFKPKEYWKRVRIDEQIESLSLEEKERMLKRKC